MAKKAETLFKEKVAKYLKTLPKTYFWVNDQRAIRGIPDISACINGVFVGLELKGSYIDTQKPSPRLKLQYHRLGEIADAGGVGWMIYPEAWQRTKELLTDLSEGRLYGHIDIRKDTQTKLRECFNKAFETRRLRSARRSQDWTADKKLKDLHAGGGRRTQQALGKIRRPGRPRKDESERGGES